MSNNRYSDSFKDDAIKKYFDIGSVNYVADLLGIQPNTLRKWIKDREVVKVKEEHLGNGC